LTSKVIGYAPDKDLINAPVIEKGRMPEKEGEIALDSTVMYQSRFKIGDTVSFETENTSVNPEEKLKHTSYEVVGFVKSPLYIEETNRGSTNLGSGVLRGISYVVEEEFTSDYYSEAYLTFSNSKDYTAYTDKYEHFIETKMEEAEKLLEKRPAERL